MAYIGVVHQSMLTAQSMLAAQVTRMTHLKVKLQTPSGRIELYDSCPVGDTVGDTVKKVGGGETTRDTYRDGTRDGTIRNDTNRAVPGCMTTTPTATPTASPTAALDTIVNVSLEESGNHTLRVWVGWRNYVTDSSATTTTTTTTNTTTNALPQLEELRKFYRFSVIDPVSIRGSVKWCRPGSESGGCFVVVEIVNSTKGDISFSSSGNGNGNGNGEVEGVRFLLEREEDSDNDNNNNNELTVVRLDNNTNTNTNTLYNFIPAAGTCRLMFKVTPKSPTNSIPPLTPLGRIVLNWSSGVGMKEGGGEACKVESGVLYAPPPPQHSIS